MDNLLVSTQWLAENLDNTNVVILDASMEKVIGMEPITYQQPTHIPNSLKLDLENALVDAESSLANAFPTPEIFNREVSKLGISSDKHIVIYDNQGVYASPRAWWIFRSMGFEKVSVLDGGLPKWIDEHRETVGETKIPQSTNIPFQASFTSSDVVDTKYVLGAIESPSVMTLDARGKARFLGTAPEPREGMRSGHIPHSLNLPFAEILNGHGFKSKVELKAIFNALLDNEPKQLIFTCGSGITACIIMLAAHIAGYTNTALYDGSWSEWGASTELPVAQ